MSHHQIMHDFQDGEDVIYSELVADPGDFECICGMIVEPDDAFECTKCHKTFCRQCFDIAKKDFEGGINVGGLDVNYCYDCSEKGVDRLLKDLQ